MNKDELKELLDCSICEYNLYEDGCPDCKMKQLALKVAAKEKEKMLEKLDDFLRGFIIPCAQMNMEVGCLRLDGRELREMLQTELSNE